MAPVPASAVTGHRARGKRARAVAATLLLLPWATGCYTYLPVWDRVPEAGKEVAVGISDRGREILAPRIGPGARLLSGRVAGLSDSALTLSVSSVEYMMSAQPARWNGEMVSIPRDLLSGVQERKLSKSRTWVAVGIAVLAVATLSTVVIAGAGSDSPSDRLPGDGQTQ